MWNWMSAAGRPGRVRTKATTSAAVEVSGPAARSSHSARWRGTVGAVEGAAVSDTSQSIVRHGWSWRLLPTPGSSWRTSTPTLAELRRRDRSRTAAGSAAMPIAPARKDHLAPARRPLAPAPGAVADPDRALALELDADDGRAGDDLQVRPLEPPVAGRRRPRSTGARPAGSPGTSRRRPARDRCSRRSAGSRRRRRPRAAGGRAGAASADPRRAARRRRRGTPRRRGRCPRSAGSTAARPSSPIPGAPCSPRGRSPAAGRGRRASRSSSSSRRATLPRGM